MKFLIDNALSPKISEGLKKAGYETFHVRDCGLQSSEDSKIFDHAKRNNCVLISTDTDFGTILALRAEKKPSVVLFRKSFPRNPEKQLKIFLKVLPGIKEELESGSIVVLTEKSIRIRRLPIT